MPTHKKNRCFQPGIWNAGFVRMDIPMYWPQVHPLFRGTLFCSLSPWWHFSSLETLSWTLSTILVNLTRQSFPLQEILGIWWDNENRNVDRVYSMYTLIFWRLHGGLIQCHMAYTFLQKSFTWLMDFILAHGDCFWTSVLAAQLPQFATTHVVLLHVSDGTVTWRTWDILIPRMGFQTDPRYENWEGWIYFEADIGTLWSRIQMSEIQKTLESGQVTFASLLILEIFSRVHIQGCRKFWCGLEALNNQHCANWSSGHLEMLWNFMKCCLKEWSLCFCFFWLNQMKHSRFQDSRSASIAFSTKICWIFPFMIHIRILSRKIAISKGRSPNQPAIEQVMIWGLLPSTRLQIVAYMPLAFRCSSIPFMFSSWRISRQFRRIICPLLFLLLPL